MSILPILSKILERHIRGIISDHLKVNAPISDQQWGFSPGKSTTSTLLSFTHDYSEALDNGKEVAAIFFDLSKAFDSVPHLLLLTKLVDIHLILMS